ncbi:type II toxin-antitoxin system RelE family toxin [Sphingobium algorifonticola]|uniref:Type II toxin-antitoxin system RelE/ParE family toxin n=1 Tax=Sphingobium algorifonticola TaxID=2008318 RepID=A0A437J8Y6_9SPHN|nr:type II toxin-antitoxin system RelE/ParE family toxin [Sphingobium algorifonticola]RVT41843.1 type II toxin-antitoxin system RelE/ParE family toxin [Sphingobium algorifonticola]
MKTYELEFLETALKEWKKLAPNIRNQFAKKLEERLRQPHVTSAQLSGMADCYKIKLRAAGYRLVYQIEDEVLLIVVIAVGKRERNAVYKTAAARLD